MQKTYTATLQSVRRDWYVVDATDRHLGRLASELAHRLRGKHKPEFTPNVDGGDYLVVVNADKIRVTGNKRQQKIYYQHSGMPGQLKKRTLNEQLRRQPAAVVETAVKGMLPKNRLGRAMFRKLKVYAGAQHPHEAQQPKQLEL